MPTDTSATDTGATDTRAERRELQRYRRLTVAVVVALAIVGGILGAANTLQGPRLTSAEVNGQGAISRVGQRVVLHANQPIAKVSESQISLSPEVAFTTTTTGSDVTITLNEMLHYDAEYSVSVTTESLYSGATADLQYTFTTPDVSVYTLIRDTGSVAGDEPDRIVQNTLSGNALSKDVFAAPRIQEYAVSGSSVAAVVLDENDETSLVVRDLSTGVETSVHVPKAGAIRYLKSSGTTGVFGFTVAGISDSDGATTPTTLFVYDLATPNGVAREVTGFDGAELPAVAWTFVPGTTSAVIQDYDQQLYLTETSSDAVPSPLGRHAEVHGFVPGTADLIVSDLEDSTRIDLRAGKSSIFTPQPVDVDPSFYPGKRLVIDDQADYIQEFDIPDADHQYSTSAVFLVDGSGTREIYRPGPTSRIRNMCLSPNGQVVAVETFPADKQNDKYPNIPSYRPMTTYFVDVASRETVRSINGWMPDWC